MSYSYHQELLTADDSNIMETTKLMQSNQTDTLEHQTLNEIKLNGTCNGTSNTIATNMNGGGVINEGGDCETKSDLCKPENIEMSTSTTSVKCCNGFIMKSKNKKKVVKETQTNGGTGNGKCYFNTFKEKLVINGKHNHQQETKCEMDGGKMKKPVVFDDRDPFKINSSIRFEFFNVYAEPNSGTYSFNPTWSFTNRMYFQMKLFIYRIFAILIGIPSAFICAIIFALFSVMQIWLINPILRIFKALFGIIREIWCMIFDTIFGPIFQAFINYKITCSNNACSGSTVSSKSIYNEDVNVV